MTGLMVNICLLTLLVVIVVMVMRTHRLFAVVVLSGAYSLICAVIFVNLDAVDVAFTEAAVGAGISTVLFLSAMAVLPANEKQPPRAHTLTSNLAGLVIVVIVGGLLMLAAFDLPAVGDPNAPAQLHVAPRYLVESDRCCDIPNVVTTVLASYRGFDTLARRLSCSPPGLGVYAAVRATRTARRRMTGSEQNRGSARDEG